MDWLTGSWSHTGVVAAKAALIYAVALLALRVGERRTIAQWTLIDFATAVAMGAIIGRTAVAATQSWVTGAVALVTLVAVHRLVSALRLAAPLRGLLDHRIRVLIEHGRLRRREMRRCGITETDLYAHLRQRGAFRLDDIRYAIYETNGALTIVPESGETPLDIVDDGLQRAADYP